MPIDRNAVVGKGFEPTRFEWIEKDVILYALGLGVGGRGAKAVAQQLECRYDLHRAKQHTGSRKCERR